MPTSFTADMEPRRQTPRSRQSDEDSRLAVVTPLFENAGSRDPWPPPSQPTRKSSRWFMAVAMLLACLVTGWVFHSKQGVIRVNERLEAGCLDVDDCRSLVQAAEMAKDGCWVGCSALGSLVAKARVRFRTALEQAALRERLRQDHDYELSLAEQREAETARADRAHVQRLEEMARQHQHALALVAAETEQRLAEKAQIAADQTAYFRQLSREQRWRRLLACQSRGTNCQELVRWLLDAAASPDERTALVEAHESFVTAGTSPASPSENRQSRVTSPTKPDNSTSTEPALL